MLTILKNRSYYNNVFISRRMSSVPLPDLHILNEKGEVKLDVLYPFRKRAPPPTAEEPTQCSLAGQPTMLPAAALQLRQDIIEKWDQKPERDIYKDSVKRTYTY